MFGLGMGEIAIILVLALILLGPERLPDAAKKLGKGLREFRKASEDLKSQFETELYQDAKPQRPTLVERPGSSGAAGAPRAPAPAGAPAAAGVPLASAENVPGLEAALAEPGPVPPAALREETDPPARGQSERSEGGPAAPDAPAAGARP